MPELPDVDRFHRVIQDHAMGKRITRVEVLDTGVVRGRSGEDFSREVRGRRFGEPERRGKWLIAPTNGPSLLFHFGMTGSLVWEQSKVERHPLDRVLMYVSGGTLAYKDLRKLRGIWLAFADDDIREIVGEQGPDALGLTKRVLEERLGGHRGALKSLLMDQRAVAGLGNMLTDEVLWRAKIHPERTFGDFSAHERSDLSRTVQQVLKASLRAQAIPRTATWLSSQRSNARPQCPRCGSSLRTSKIGGRTTYWCHTCQTPPV